MSIINSIEDVRSAASRWDVNEEDVLLIALNQCGARSIGSRTRMRVQLELLSRPADPVFVILSLDRIESPFQLDGHVLRLGGEAIATVAETEDDDAVLSYFRKDKRVITLNSNARSQCVGCAFCPNTMEAASDPKLRAADDLGAYFKSLATANGWEDLQHIEKVTVCTGCFHEEPLALRHLESVREAMSTTNDCATLQFLSSVLRTPEGIATVASTGPFQLSVTIECFSRRAEVLKQSKASLSPKDVTPILRAASDVGATANFTYIVGLDDYAPAIETIADYADVATSFPLFQVFQPHSPFMDTYVVEEARSIDYYLKFRKSLEALFYESGLRPFPWENYRSLWYFTFADEYLPGPRK